MSRRHGYGRKAASREPRPKIVVLVEGEVTETEYLAALRDTLGIPRTLISIRKAQHSDADGIVGEAREIKRSRKNQDGGVDEVWVVSDTESEHENGSPENIARAINRTGDNVHLVLDSPGIEYWFLLHYCYTTKCYTNVDEVIGELHQCWPEYSKQKSSLDWSSLIEQTRIAMKNAAHVRMHREGSGSRLPIADADILVAKLVAMGKNDLPYGNAETGQATLNRGGKDGPGNRKKPRPLTYRDLYSWKYLHGS